MLIKEKVGTSFNNHLLKIDTTGKGAISMCNECNHEKLPLHPGVKQI